MAAPAPAPTAAAASASSSSSSSAAAPPPAAAAIGPPPECPVCTESYECAEGADPSRCRLPRTLPCAHSVCSACLLKLLAATQGRVLCPACRAKCSVKWRRGMLPAALARLIPQNADLIQSIQRSAQLEAMMLQQQQQRVQVQPASDAQARCSYHADCTASAARWCEECDAAACEAHDTAAHGHFLSAHNRMPLSQKEAARQAKIQAVLAAAGAQVKAAAAAAVQQQKVEEAKQRLLLTEQQRLHEESVALLAQMEAAAARLASMSDVEAQQQEAELARLMHIDRPAAAPAPTSASASASAPALASGLLASLTAEQTGHLRRFLGGGNELAKGQLLYRATRDGFDAADLWQRCAGKASTLTLVKVARNGFVCGAYTPVRWPANAAGKEDQVADPSGHTFLFSLVNTHGRPVKLRLKEGQRSYALFLHGGGGPGFGGGADLCLMRGGRPANSANGCRVYPHSFELDQAAETAAGLPVISFAYDKALLVGDDGSYAGVVDFAAAQIEVYQL